MEILFPSRMLAPYVEAYYLSSDLTQDNHKTGFPAVSTSYIKLSPASAIVSGQATRPTVAEIASGEMMGLGAKLRAGAFYALFGIPASELTNRVVRLDEVLGPAATELIVQMPEVATPATLVECFERTFTLYARRHLGHGGAIEQQAVALMRQLPTMPLSQLAETLGYSSRQLQRKLKAVIGLNPSLYKRICRFEQAIALIQPASRREKIDWLTIALDCGYSDQAHFIRDFREFAGQTPTLYVASLQGNPTHTRRGEANLSDSFNTRQALNGRLGEC